MLESTRHTNTMDSALIADEFWNLRLSVNNIIIDMYTNVELNDMLGKNIDDIASDENRRNIESILSDYLNQNTFIRSIHFFSASSENLKFSARNLWGIRDISYNDLGIIEDEIIWVLKCKPLIGDTLMFVRNLRDTITSNELLGTYAIVLDSNYLRRTLSVAKTTPTGYVLLVDRNNNIVFHHGNLGSTDRIADDFSFLQVSDGTVVNTGYERALVSKRQIDSIDMTLFIVTPISDLRISGNVFRDSLIILAVALFFLYFILSWLISNYLLKPIATLITTMRRVVDEGSHVRYEVKTQDEFGDIGNTFNKMLEKISTLHEENYMIAIRERDARIQTLQAQINPHFIYNTLDAISWKVSEYGDSQVNDIISGLGEMLRYSTEKYKTLVTLGEELYQIQNYLLINNMRVDTKVSYHVTVEPELLDVMIPCLLLQPIVENAIMHGLKDKEENPTLTITVKKRGNDFVVTVIDNGSGIPKEKLDLLNKGNVEESHIGLRNVRERCHLLYGDGYGLYIKSEENLYTEVSIVFPLN